MSWAVACESRALQHLDGSDVVFPSERNLPAPAEAAPWQGGNAEDLTEANCYLKNPNTADIVSVEPPMYLKSDRIFYSALHS